MEYQLPLCILCNQEEVNEKKKGDTYFFQIQI